MDEPNSPTEYASFLGTGWSFPPEFDRASNTVIMHSDEQDILESLQILFHTVQGERFLQPRYGLDLGELMFEPISTTMRTYIADRIRIAILIHEPRIEPIDLRVDSPDPNDGTLKILLEYEVRATNSRFNLVFPFYRIDPTVIGPPVVGMQAHG